MRLIIDLGQMLEVEVGIHLGRRDMGVSQQLLYGAQVAAGLEQVGSKGVAQDMGMDLVVQTLLAGAQGHARFDGAHAQGRTADTDEQGGLRRQGPQGVMVQPECQGFPGLLTHGDDAEFMPFSQYPHQALAEIQVLYAQMGQFRQTQAGGVEQFQQGPVPFIQHAVPRDIHQSAGLVRRKGMGQGAR